MKINVAYPATGSQKCFEIDDDLKLRHFYEKRMAQETEADTLGDEWKGYVVRITGGNDKQGFPMKQGVLTNGRARLLLKQGQSCFRARRKGERKRKSVRGCIVDSNLSVLNLIVVKKGEQEIPGLTDKTQPRRLGPKRASKIRKLFNLSKEDDVRQYVIKRKLPMKEGQKKAKYKSPKIQRLITPMVLQRKRHRLSLKKKRRENKRDQEAAYAKILALRVKEARDRKEERKRSASLRRSSARASQSSDAPAAAPTPAPSKPAKPAKSAAPPAKPAKSAAPAAKPAKSAAPPPKPAKSAAPAAKQAKSGAPPAKQAKSAAKPAKKK